MIKRLSTFYSLIYGPYNMASYVAKYIKHVESNFLFQTYDSDTRVKFLE